MKNGKISRIIAHPGFQLAPFAFFMVSALAPGGSPVKKASFDVGSSLLGVNLIQVARQEIGGRKRSKDGPPRGP